VYFIYFRRTFITLEALRAERSGIMSRLSTGITTLWLTSLTLIIGATALGQTAMLNRTPSALVQPASTSDVPQAPAGFTSNKAGAREASTDRFSVFERIQGDSWEIFLSDGQSQEVRQLTDHFASDRFPLLSPDQQRVAFVSWRDGNPEIYVLDVRSGDLRNVSNHPALDLLPNWSPDSRLLAFVSERDGNAEIYLADVDRGLLLNLTHSVEHDTQPQWSQNGGWIEYQSYVDNRVDARGSHSFPERVGL
jgi:dipeptidyl aminopeptidase/acylaminoacyl peptidase